MKVIPTVCSPGTDLARHTARLSLKSQRSFKGCQAKLWSNSLNRWANQTALNAMSSTNLTLQPEAKATTQEAPKTPENHKSRTRSSSCGSVIFSPQGEEFTPGEMSPTLGYSTVKKCSTMSGTTPVRGSGARRSRRVLNQPAFKECAQEIKVGAGKFDPPKNIHVANIYNPQNIVSQTMPRPSKQDPAPRQGFAPFGYVQSKAAVKATSKRNRSIRKRRKSKGLLCGMESHAESPMVSPLRRSPRLSVRNSNVDYKPPSFYVFKPGTAPIQPEVDYYASFKIPTLEKPSTTSPSSMLDAVLSTLSRKSRHFGRSPKISEEQNEMIVEQKNIEAMEVKGAKDTVKTHGRKVVKEKEKVMPEKRFVSSLSVPMQIGAFVERSVKVVPSYFDAEQFPMIDQSVVESPKVNMVVKSVEKKEGGGTAEMKGENLERKGENVESKKGENVERKGENVESKKGENVKRKGLNVERKGLDVERKGLDVDRKGLNVERKGENVERKGIHVEKKGGNTDRNVEMKKENMNRNVGIKRVNSDENMEVTSQKDIGPKDDKVETDVEMVHDRSLEETVKYAETWKRNRLTRRPTRKESFRKAVFSPNPVKDTENVVADEEEGDKKEVMDMVDELEVKAESLHGKENVCSPAKLLRKGIISKSVCVFPLSNESADTEVKQRSMSASKIQTQSPEEGGFLIRRPKRQRSVQFLERPTEIGVGKGGGGGGTLKRRVSSAALLLKQGRMKRSRSSERLRRSCLEEGMVVVNAGHTPRPQRQPSEPFQERLIM